MRRIFTVLLVAAAWCLPAIAQAAQLVVVEARGVGFAPGATLDSTKPITLQEGQHLTLISQSGNTIKLDGPFSGAPGEGSSGGVTLSDKIAALGGGGQRFAEVGTTRATKAAALPSPWLLDVSHSGPACTEEGRMPVLWRPSAASATDIVITPDDRSWRATIAWPADADELPLAASVPLHAGTTYYIDMNGERRALSITTVPATLSSDRMRAAWLADKGCEAQARALLQAAK